MKSRNRPKHKSMAVETRKWFWDRKLGGKRTTVFLSSGPVCALFCMVVMLTPKLLGLHVPKQNEGITCPKAMITWASWVPGIFYIQ